MPDCRTTPVDLLAGLYEAAATPGLWQDFLARLAGLFDSGTASLRVVDCAAPLVHQSFTVGFDPAINRRYVEQQVGRDPFPEIHRAHPPGKILCSHHHIDDRDFERSAHYQTVLRPNGNFYLMGAHVERSNGRALQIGVHRPRTAGPFLEHERRRLEFFSPHFLQAGRIMRRLGTLEAALRQARVALDRLPFAIWMLDRDLGCQWLNAAAEEILRAGSHGLGLHKHRLAMTTPAAAAELRQAQKALNHHRSQVAFVRSGLNGAFLVLLAGPANDIAYRLGDADGILVFLLDPERSVLPDHEALRQLYSLTPAEIRLVAELLQGQDLTQASARLGISPHTARSQIKSALQKTDSKRQSELIRKLLLGPGSLDLTDVRPPGA